MDTQLDEVLTGCRRELAQMLWDEVGRYVHFRKDASMLRDFSALDLHP
jgi:hypothetical protein